MDNKSTKKNTFAQFQKKKLVIIIIGIVLLTIPILLFLFGVFNPDSVRGTITLPKLLQPSPTPVLSALQKAINAQKNVDGQHATWQENVKTNYPWMNKLPLSSPKYFVYFDINRKIFIGKLYAPGTDNNDALKAEIKKNLKEKGVPTDIYQFEWVINQ